MTSTTHTPTESPGPALIGVTPHVTVRDANAAAEFYTRAFGAQVLAKLPGPDATRLMHCHLLINGGALFINDAMPEHGYPLLEPQSFALHLQVEDADAWFARAVEAGATAAMPVDLMFWGDRYGQVVDPFGVRWSIGSHNR